MTAKFEIENPGEVRMTLTATMPLDAWIRVREAMRTFPWHSSTNDFAAALDDMVLQARKTFVPEHKDDEG